MRLIHLPIQRKLFLIVAGTIAVFSVALTAAVWRTREIGRDAGQMYGRMTEPLHLLGDLEAQFVQTRISIRDALLSRTPAERQQHVEIVKRLIGDVRLKCTAFEAFAKDDPKLRNLYHDYTVKLEEFIDVGGRVLAADASGDRERALEIMHSECIPDAAALRVHLQHVRGILLANAHTLEDDLGSAVADTQRLVVLLACLAFVVALSLGHRISRRITNDVKTLRSALDRVAAGDLEVTVKVVSGDELGQMADALTQVIAQERQVVTATEQLAQGNLSASGALRGEHDALGRAVQQLQPLEHELLNATRALEAQVLAARRGDLSTRAGDAGRGFAVVAEEVRGLALRSAEAARSTSALIAAQRERADEGVKLNAVQLVLGEIDQVMHEVHGAMDALRTHTVQEHERINDIAGRVAELNRVTQDAAAQAEESAAGSTELRDQSARLAGAVRGFKTRDLVNRPVMPPRASARVLTGAGAS